MKITLINVMRIVELDHIGQGRIEISLIPRAQVTGHVNGCVKNYKTIEKKL